MVKHLKRVVLAYSKIRGCEGRGEGNGGHGNNASLTLLPQYFHPGSHHQTPSSLIRSCDSPDSLLGVHSHCLTKPGANKS